jgi:hypothetical protein
LEKFYVFLFCFLIAIAAIARDFGIPKLRANKARKILRKINTHWVLREFLFEVKSELKLEGRKEWKRKLVKKVSVFQKRRKQARQLASPTVAPLQA